MFHLYGLFIGIAIVAGWSVAEKIEPRVNKVAPWVIIFGIFGARLYHVMDMWSYYSQNLSSIVKLWEGGLSIWGGIIGGYAAFVIINHKFSNSQIEKWNILGAIATALPLSQAIGRIGNGVNGEFINKVWILPWWAAEAGFDLTLFGILWFLRVRGLTPKFLVGVYLFGYGLIRYFLQPYR